MSVYLPTNSQTTILKFLTHPLVPYGDHRKREREIFLFISFMLCLHNAPNFLTEFTEFQNRPWNPVFIIQVTSFCPSSFLKIVIPAIIPTILRLILWIDKREAFSGFCPQFSAPSGSQLLLPKAWRSKDALCRSVYSLVTHPLTTKGFIVYI